MTAPIYLRKTIRLLRFSWSKASERGAVGLLAILCVALWGLVAILSATLSPPHWASILAVKALLLTSLVLVAIEISEFTRTHSDSLSFKWLLRLIFSALSLGAIVLASHTLHSLVHEAPRHFAFSVSLLAIVLFVPMVVVVASWIGGWLAVVAILFACWDTLLVKFDGHWTGRLAQRLRWMIVGTKPASRVPRSWTVMVARAVGFLSIGLLSAYMHVAHQAIKLYLGVDIDWVASRVIEWADYYDDAYCLHLPEGARVAYLDNGRISVATRHELGHTTFSTRDCVPADIGQP